LIDEGVKMKSLDKIAEKSALNKRQLEKIEQIILSHGNYTQETVRKEIEWFCKELGMDEYYFKTTSLETIAAHIEALKAAEIIASLQKEKTLKIDLATEREKEAIYLVDDYHYRALEIEKRIEEKYPNSRLQSYRTKGKALGIEHLRMYMVYKPSFRMDKILKEETDLKKIACKKFLASTPRETYQRYQKAIEKSKGWETPLIDVFHNKKSREVCILVVTNRDGSSRFFSNVSDVINSHGLVSKRKYVEQFQNGKTIYTFHLDEIQDEKKIHDITEDISLVYVIPESPLSPLFRMGKLTAQETVFGVSAWTFAHQFLTEANEEYLRLRDVLEDSPELLGILRNLKTGMVKGTFDEAKVWEALVNNYTWLKKAFDIFDRKFNPLLKDHDIEETLTKLKQEVRENITVDIERDIFLYVLLFIEVILKTNFYVREKTSLSFLLDPRFLNRVDYPEQPYGIILVIGSEFRGFHVRFRDIARGGIRIVRSPNLQSYLSNSDFIFDENYNLALTQQAKNKDLPEGGSKGTILLRFDAQERSESAFKKYIDGLLDLMLPEREVVDYYGKEIILFLGPDEGTAEFMEWASLRAKIRGYRYWKSFSTGKPVGLGGIPHDLYGMTTNSIHQYVLNILRKRGLREEKITKVMTGGPDGDLGSNEILISKDKILAIIDGSGVLYDPEGINREELKSLARKRKMIENFSRRLISPQGFLVTIKDRNITLPDGEIVANGLEFRNSFHLHPKFKADLFVPCGGRPASININNWREFLDENQEPRFKFIVEGANLFLTQEARLRLEEKGVIIYKDSSANKGGVTSSSLEVLASLALSDEEYERLMCVKKGKISSFRKRFIKEIIEIIKENASLEFETIWKENELKKIPRPVLSDLLSQKINRLKDAIASSTLHTDKALFSKVIECCCPPVLIKQVGFENILDRVPATYLKAIFASKLASRFVYEYGLDSTEIDFYTYLRHYR